MQILCTYSKIELLITSICSNCELQCSSTVVVNIINFNSKTAIFYGSIVIIALCNVFLVLLYTLRPTIREVILKIWDKNAIAATKTDFYER